MRGFRKINNSNDILSNYLLSHPDANWKDDFRSEASQDDLNAIYDDIYIDQKGICAYCEITLKWPTDEYTKDFRIEHFHPENCGDDNTHNYALDWNNLLGCCHGGTQKTSRSYVDATFGKKHHSCDAPKGNKILDNVILNPLVDLPEDKTFFEFDENGSIHVSDNCPDILKDKAQATIKELNLDCERLRGFRLVVIDSLRSMIDEETSVMHEGKSLEEIILELREDLLTSVNRNEFHSTIDWYLAI